MYDYTKLKGIGNFNESQMEEEVVGNMLLFFDWGFLNVGAYNTVRLGQQDINGGVRSVLKPVRDPNYTDGRVWQLPVRNLVWESGVSVGSPVAISGVYVGGSFLPLSTSGQYAYNIDYENGRAIFNSGLPLTSNVQMEYSNKTIDFRDAKKSPLMQFLQYNSFDINTPEYIAGSGEWSILSPNRIQLPHVAFEINPSVTSKPYELGSFTENRYVDILVHCFDDDDKMTSKIAGIFMDQNEKTIYFLDLQKIAEDNGFALDYRGFKKAIAKTYPELVGEDGSIYRKTKIRISKAYVSTSSFINYSFKSLLTDNLHHIVVRLTLEIVHTF